MRILLVWSSIPDLYVAIYDLEIGEETFTRWSKVHGVYGGNIGCNDEQESIIEEISTEIAKIKPNFADEDDNPGKAPILLQYYSALIMTGFVF